MPQFIKQLLYAKNYCDLVEEVLITPPKEIIEVFILKNIKVKQRKNMSIIDLFVIEIYLNSYKI